MPRGKLSENTLSEMKLLCDLISTDNNKSADLDSDASLMLIFSSFKEMMQKMKEREEREQVLLEEVKNLKEALAQKLDPEKPEKEVEILDVVQGGEPFVEAVSHTTKKELTTLRNAVKRLQDESDHHQQYSHKGNVILHSESLAAKLEEGPLSEDQHLEWCLKEVERYSAVKVEKSDLTACHPLAKPGSAVLRFRDRLHGSKYSRLSTAIMKGGVYGEAVRSVKEANKKKGRGEELEEYPPRLGVFLNFQLTGRRAKIQKKLRDLKKEKKISTYFTDCNGNLYLRVSENSPKIRLTVDINDNMTHTFTLKEIQDLV